MPKHHSMDQYENTNKYAIKMTQSDVDGGWAWIVMFASFMLFAHVSFIPYTSGIFHGALLNEFNRGNAATSVPGSMLSSVLCLAGPFAGMLVNRTNCRTSAMLGGLFITLGFASSYFATSLDALIVTYGFITGVGVGFCVVPPLVMVGYSFNKYRGIATGVVVSGGGLGIFVCGPLCQLTLDTYGLHGAFLVTGGICSHMILFGALMRPSASEMLHKKRRKEISEESTDRCAGIRSILDIDVLTNKSFLLILLSALLWRLTYTVVTVHLPYFAITRGATLITASMLTAQMGVGSIFSRVISGLVAGKQSGIDPVLLDMGALALTGGVTILFPFYSDTFLKQSIYSVLIGMYLGSLMTFIVPVCVEIIGISKLPAGVGLTYFASGIGAIFGPILAGLMYDESGRYEYSFYFAGACSLVGSLLVLLSTIWRSDSITKESSLENKDSNIDIMAGSLPMLTKLEFMSSETSMHTETVALSSCHEDIEEQIS